MSRKSLLLSNLLHALIALALFLPTLTPPEKPNEPATVQVAIVEAQTAPSKGTTTSKKIPSAKSPSAKSDLEKFFPQMALDDSGALKSANKQTASADDVGERWRNDWEFGADIEDLARKSGRAGFYAEIHRRIDSNLLFDDVLAEYAHFGEVKMKFAVTPDGKLLEDSMQAWAPDRVLKVRVVWALRAALKDSLKDPQQLKPPGPYWIGARFYYSKDGFCRATSGSSAEMLTFCRTTRERPPASNIISELADNNVRVEEAPINGYHGETKREQKVWFDFNFEYEKIAKYKRKVYRKETNFDPFEREKRDRAWDL